MKIIGVTYGEAASLLLKGDSALLVNRKPFFVPDETRAPVAYPALALRVCRLGKTIAPLEQAQANGEPWTTAISLDGSFPLGDWKEANHTSWTYLTNGTDKLEVSATEEQIHDAVSLVSRYMTIRQGDVIYLQLTDKPIELRLNDCLTARPAGDETDALLCRIK